MKRLAAFLLVLLAGGGVLFVVDQAIRTLRTLAIVERERDTWQRPDAIIGHLNLQPGQTVLDLGSGAGYFALKLAPRVAPGGQVLAVDLRRLSLAFLWIRARQGGHANLRVIVGAPDDPRLPPGPIDGVLIANTLHELAPPGPILTRIFASMRPGGRLVVVDRGPHGREEADAIGGTHELSAATAEALITRHGFQAVARDDRFIDRSGDDDVWWLRVFRRP
ncbi:MAG: class I SAM-dependent methyltransferase [Vicinamibacterales bacterium]